MKKQKGNIEGSGQEVLSIPQVLLDAAGIDAGSDLTVETIPGVLLIVREEPLKQANRPYLKLFSDLGIEPEEVTAILKKGGYFS